MKLIKVLFFMIILAIPVFGINAYFNNVESDCVKQMIADGADTEYAEHLCKE